MELQATCDAVEAHSCVDSDSEISFDEQYTTVDTYVFSAICNHSCKQLTKTFGSKGPAVECLSTVVHCSSSETPLSDSMYRLRVY